MATLLSTTVKRFSSVAFHASICIFAQLNNINRRWYGDIEPRGIQRVPN